MNEDLVPVIVGTIVGGSALGDLDSMRSMVESMTRGVEMFYRTSDGELVDGEGNVTSHVDPSAQRSMQWRFAFGERPADIVLQQYGVKWGEALGK